MRFPRLNPGDRLSADLVNRMLDALEKLLNMTVDPSSGIELVKSGGNMMLRLTDVGEVAAATPDVVLRITSTSASTLTDGLYPAAVDAYVDSGTTPPQWSEGDEVCWALDPNDNPLLGQRYVGVKVGQHSDGKTIYATQSPATSYAVSITGNNSGNGLYPCVYDAYADQPSPSWQVGSNQSGWVMALIGHESGPPLTVGRGYQSVYIGQHSDGKPVFAVTPWYGYVNYTTPGILDNGQVQYATGSITFPQNTQLIPGTKAFVLPGLVGQPEGTLVTPGTITLFSNGLPTNGLPSPSTPEMELSPTYLTIAGQSCFVELVANVGQFLPDGLFGFDVNGVSNDQYSPSAGMQVYFGTFGLSMTVPGPGPNGFTTLGLLTTGVMINGQTGYTGTITPAQLETTGIRFVGGICMGQA